MQNQTDPQRPSGAKLGTGGPDLSENRVTPTETRQGSRGTPVLWVLIAAMLLAGIYLATTMSWTTTQTNDRAPSSQTATGTGTNAAGARSGDAAAGGAGGVSTGAPAADQTRR